MPIYNVIATYDDGEGVWEQEVEATCTEEIFIEAQLGVIEAYKDFSAAKRKILWPLIKNGEWDTEPLSEFTGYRITVASYYVIDADEIAKLEAEINEAITNLMYIACSDKIPREQSRDITDVVALLRKLKDRSNE